MIGLIVAWSIASAIFALAIFDNVVSIIEWKRVGLPIKTKVIWTVVYIVALISCVCAIFVLIRNT